MIQRRFWLFHSRNHVQQVIGDGSHPSVSSAAGLVRELTRGSIIHLLYLPMIMSERESVNVRITITFDPHKRSSRQTFKDAYVSSRVINDWTTHVMGLRSETYEGGLINIILL